MRKATKFRVTRTNRTGFGVISPDGAMLYDLLDNRQIAKDIAAVLNDGCPQDWCHVEEAIEKLERARS